MAETTTKLILRHQFESYMECTGTDGTKSYELIGEGFTAFPVALNPAEYSRKYINDKTERSDVVGFSPSVSYSCDCVAGNPVVDEIIKITDRELLGSDALRNIVSVNRWQRVGTSGNVYSASKREYAIVPGGKGDGTDALIYTGTMKAHGDPVFGSFDCDKMTFTEEGTSASDTCEV